MCLPSSLDVARRPLPEASDIIIDSQPDAQRGPRRAAIGGRWKLSWIQLVACLIILAGICTFLYPDIASWFAQREQSEAINYSQTEEEEPPHDEAARAEALAAAHRYNDALASGALLRANANIAVGDGTRSDESLVYADLLNLGGEGFMGRLKYDALAIDLPIYHGTSDETLQRGIGHLEGTSLPVGGTGTRSVLTAHRGLPEATLFNDLDKAKVGQTFTVSVLGQVLTYQVTEIQTVDPSATKSILADPDRDLISLVTCTPLGINSHRILVTAERILPTPAQDIVAAAEPPTVPGFPWWAVILAGSILVLGLYLWRSGYETVPAPRRQ